ncbi:unnamed protein product [Polarella glacialis]|uniref:Uncharacterized protein n=1 Tax=Polarella glacialis TaxID=89957 RepID=A0A813IR44_POLGL|nr:unnamed protein product [Polarella glacialis]
MAPVVKTLKKKAVAAKAGTASPKLSPKTSPMLSPKASPKASPAAAPAGGGNRQATGEERQAAMKKAIEVIEAGLKSESAAQAKGDPFIPKGWRADFKQVLGPYRKFVDSCSHFRVEQGDTASKYTIHLASDGGGADKLPKWEEELQKAWQTYLKMTDKTKREPDEFVAKAKSVVAKTGSKEAKEKKVEEKKKRKEDGKETAPKKKAKTATKKQEEEEDDDDDDDDEEDE